MVVSQANLVRAAVLLGLVGSAAGILPRKHDNWVRSSLGKPEAYSSSAKATLPCSAPTRRAPVVFPEDLVVGSDAEGLEMHSGYVNVTDEDFLFYWFVKASADAPLDAPVLIWSNGGPGCSAMEGATTELGPLIVYMAKESGDAGFSYKLTRNPYAWSQKAHLLFVDQPRYVGYSCGTGSYVCSSREAGLDMVTFIRGWRSMFPEIADPKFILASESYGGHYVPAWTEAILDHNAAAHDPIPLAGLAIGNGIVNETVQNAATFVEFAKRQGLIPQDASVTTESHARSLIRKHLGYEPNYYDYRLEDLGGCCGCFSYNYTTWSYWLLRESVTKALNVCGGAGEKAFGGCAGGCINFEGCRHGFDNKDAFDYSGALDRALSLGIPVTLFYGMQDTACDYVGGYAMASSLAWAGAENWAATPLEALEIGGGMTGRVQAAAGLTWIQVQGAGHMVPINNAGAAFYALTTLLPQNASAASAPPPLPAAPALGQQPPQRETRRSSFLARQRAAQHPALAAAAAGGEDMDGLALLQTAAGPAAAAGRREDEL